MDRMAADPGLNVVQNGDQMPVPSRELRDTIATFSKEVLSNSVVPIQDQQDRGFQYIELLAQRLHRRLADHGAFQHAANWAFVNKPQGNNPRNYQLLGETAQLRVGILTLFRFSPMTMHDHLGAHGAQLVLGGQARMRQYEYLSETEKDRRLVMLERSVDRVIEKGDWVSYTPDHSNIHEFDVRSQRMVMFSVILSPPVEDARSWFFPADPFDGNQRRLYTRVAIGRRSPVIPVSESA